MPQSRDAIVRRDDDADGDGGCLHSFCLAMRSDQDLPGRTTPLNQSIRTEARRRCGSWLARNSRSGMTNTNARPDTRSIAVKSTITSALRSRRSPLLGRRRCDADLGEPSRPRSAALWIDGFLQKRAAIKLDNNRLNHHGESRFLTTRKVSSTASDHGPTRA
jgi:hypothetical protein